MVGRLIASILFIMEEPVFKAARPGERDKLEQEIEDEQTAQDEKDGICRGSCGS